MKRNNDQHNQPKNSPSKISWMRSNEQGGKHLINNDQSKRNNQSAEKEIDQQKLFNNRSVLSREIDRSNKTKEQRTAGRKSINGNCSDLSPVLRAETRTRSTISRNSRCAEEEARNGSNSKEHQSTILLRQETHDLNKSEIWTDHDHQKTYRSVQQQEPTGINQKNNQRRPSKQPENNSLMNNFNCPKNNFVSGSPGRQETLRKPINKKK